MKPKKRAIILRLPESLVDRLDAVVFDLGMPSRSYYLRRSIEASNAPFSSAKLTKFRFSTVRRW
jgi:hypothetical protein